MLTDLITFAFDGQNYHANILKVSPPPDTQFHVMVQDGNLKQRFGDLFIIFYDPKKVGSEFSFSFPKGDKDYAWSIVAALKKRVHELNWI